MTRPPLSFKLGTVAGSTSSAAGQKGTVSAPGFRVACSLLSGAGALMAATPSEAAIVYSGKKNITVNLPGPSFDPSGDLVAAGAINTFIEPVSGANIAFGWYGNTDNTLTVLAVSNPLSIAVGDPIAAGSPKTQLASYSTGESIGATGSYKTPNPTDPNSNVANTFFWHITDTTSTKSGDLITDWQLGSTAFVGLRADSAQGSNYGWMRFTTPPNFNENAPLTLVDWAYESELDTAILAGDGAPEERGNVASTPAPLPALGAAAALAASRRLRRRVKQAADHPHSQLDQNHHLAEWPRG